MAQKLSIDQRHRLFVKEYIKDRNATRAYESVYGKTKGSAQAASRLLNTDKVKKRIELALRRVEEKAELKASDVLAELRKHAFANITRAFDKKGNLKPLHKIPKDVQVALNSIESDEIYVGRGSARAKIGHTRKIKMTDKLKALELLAKHFKLLTDVQEITGKDGGPQVIVNLPGNGSEQVVAPKPEAMPTPPIGDGNGESGSGP